MFYSPFNHIKNIFQITELEFDDLKILSSIDEGYSIEYKGQYNEKVKTEGMPKTICAFANSNGGWLFIGVNDNGSISPFDLNNITKESIYSSIASRVSPMPIFDIVFLKKNNSNNGVIAIYVTEGKNTPYMANGNVYVRNGKESKSSDRATLDILIKKSMNYSDLSVKCLNGENNLVAYEKNLKYSPIKTNEDLFFENCFIGNTRIALYLENNGKHYDESIDLTLKIKKDYFIDIKENLFRCANLDLEEYFNAFVGLHSIPNISIYQSPKIFSPLIPPNELLSKEHYRIEYVNYVYDSQYQDYEVFKDKEYVYYKIKFGVINPGQKIFLPSALIFRENIDEIEYNITSKYSTEIKYGIIKK